MAEKYTTAGAITAHDSNDQDSGTIDAIYVGVAGDVKVTMAEDTVAVTFKNMLAGTIYPISCKVIFSTGTTATDIVKLDDSKTYS
jgi:hypothetical protein